MPEPRSCTRSLLPRPLATAALLLLLAAPAPAPAAETSPPPTPLAVESPVEGALGGETTRVFTVAAGRGDYLAATFEQQGIDVLVVLEGPDGEVLGEFDSPTGDTGPERVSWIAEETGEYRLLVRPFAPEDPPGRFRASLDEQLTPEERIGWSRPLVSPRLQALERELEADGEAALERFWNQVEEAGAPLVEPLPEDPDRLLVTFLWRDDGETRNVYLMSDLEPTFAGGRLERLPGSDVFYGSYEVPRGARINYQLSPNDSEVPLSEVDWSDPAAAARRSATFGPDPLNPNHFRDPTSTPPVFVPSIVELPGAEAGHWQEREGVPRGEVEREIFTSEVLDNRRLVRVYTPPGYDPEAGAYPLAVFLGGHSYAVDVPAPVVLDNLIAEGRLAPMVAVMVANPNLEQREIELTCHPPFNELLVEELLPWVRERYAVTDDPRHTSITGFSLGGLAAACAGLERPETFGNVISQSGSFWWRPEGDEQWEWLTRRFAEHSPVPVRFYIEVGVLEHGPKNDDSPTQLTVNRHLRDVLRAKGYDLVYREFPGTHHSVSWRVTLADALAAIHGTGTPVGDSERPAGAGGAR